MNIKVKVIKKPNENDGKVNVRILELLEENDYEV